MSGTPRLAAPHPAAQAWQACSGQPFAGDVCALQEEARRSVYRLGRTGPGSTNVVAKRSTTAEIAVETRLYATVLPRLRIPTVRCLGQLDDRDGTSWLFLEEAQGRPYEAGNAAHRALASDYLARLHVEGIHLAATPGLAERGQGAFRDLLPTAVARLDLALETNDALQPQHRAVLVAIREQCGQLEAVWPRLVALESQLPQTLVHGDFKEDNMLVRQGPAGEELVVFDWQQGGVGLPALDLAKFLGYSVAPDLEAYCQHAHGVWPFCDPDCVLRIGYVGEIFRWLASVRWEAEQLFHAWPEAPISCFEVYEVWMREVLAARPWVDPWSSDRVPATAVVPRTWH